EISVAELMFVESLGQKLFLRELGGHGGEDFLHLPGEAVGLVDAADLRVAIPRAQQRAELAITVKPFVIDLDDENVMETGKDIFEAGRQRIEMLDVDGGDAITGGARLVHDFLDRALRATPTDEQHITF